MNLLQTRAHRIHPLAANLYRDRYFVPLYGRPFDTLGRQERQQFARTVVRGCRRAQQHRAAWREFNYWIDRPFAVERGSFSFQYVTQQIRTKRAHRQWMDKTLNEIDALPADEASWQRLSRAVAEGNRRLVALWPSEKRTFTDAAEQRQRSLANQIARQQIESAPVAAPSLKAIDRSLVTLRTRLGRAPADPSIATLAEKRRQEIRTAVAARETTAVSAAPATVDGLIELATRTDRLNTELGKLPAGFQDAVRARAEAIAPTALRSFERQMQAVPNSFAGARDAKEKSEAVTAAVGKIAPAQRAAFRRVADVRIGEIHDALLEDTQDEIANLRAGSWRVIPSLNARAEEWAARFDKEGAPKHATRVKKAAAARFDDMIRAQLPQFKAELAGAQLDWAALGKVEKLSKDVADLQRKWPAYRAYKTALDARRGAVLDGIETASAASISGTGADYKDLTAIFETAQSAASQFEKIGENERASRLLAQGIARADAVAALSFDGYLDDLEAVEATPDAPIHLQVDAQRFDEQGAVVPTLEVYADAARARADDIRGELCEAPFKQSKVDRDLADRPILGRGGPVTVKQFICAIDANGHRVTELTTSWWSKPAMKIKQADGEFIHLRLHEVEAMPGKKMLVAFSKGDANKQQEISVDDWRSYASALMRERPHGIPDAKGVTACDRLAADPADPRRVTEGVAMADFDADSALEACAAAIEYDPNNPRLHFQLGRTLVAMGQEDQALDFLEPAAEVNYPAAEGYIGDMLFADEKGGDSSFKAAMAYYGRAAKGGYKPAADVIASLKIPENTPGASAPAGGSQSFSAKDYRQPRIVTAMLKGDFGPLQNANKKFVRFYLLHFVGTYNQVCPGALDQRVANTIINQQMGGALASREAFAAYGWKKLGETFKGLANPQQMIRNEMNNAVIKQDASKDAINLSGTFGCESKKMQGFFRNVQAYFRDPTKGVSSSKLNMSDACIRDLKRKDRMLDRHARQWCGCAVPILSRYINKAQRQQLKSNFSSYSRKLRKENLNLGKQLQRCAV
ncbi:MAG: tetratricopeptide repeat protein [Alphaproteobacteria bacterium]|nr:tetratricopeptide repeat protein [Alphaproteobacteria bacterium]